jgi:hypothetical protein
MGNPLGEMHITQEDFSMRRIPIFTLLAAVVLVSAACAGPASEPTPTVTPEPPTSTPLPTETPTPLPTATSTPDKAATAAVEATQIAGDVQAELGELLGDSATALEGGTLLWQQTERMEINLRGPDGRFLEFAEGMKGKNFVMKSDVTWNATGILVCGIIFRSEPDFRNGDQYTFLFLRFSGAPAWAIQYHEFGYFKNSPSGTQYSSAVDLTNGATNQIVLVAQDNQFNVFINGTRQGRYFDNSSQRTDGEFAFVGYQDSGDGLCKYENTVVWEIE